MQSFVRQSPNFHHWNSSLNNDLTVLFNVTLRAYCQKIQLTSSAGCSDLGY